MMLERINLEPSTDLYVIARGAVNADGYITDIVEPYVVLFVPFIRDEYLLMQDNARLYTTNVVRTYLNEVNFVTINGPAKSSDLNLIEHARTTCSYSTPATPDLRRVCSCFD
ncbi:hypothetical protein BDFB_011804 [Asbolus verrucosus]|uniref:DDE 3 domain containing protein n=1 Tax=Asbolus verrucosus TaxID=1661398 RepID=A0A482VXY4_ASBVE|nr:hypothetical protein BDFB_011804 [Asbolus verrucosus]